MKHYQDFISENNLSLGADRGDIIKIKRSKWEVFKKLDDYTFWVYKEGTAKKKAYELSCVGGNNFEVWQTGGSGQKLKSKPDAKGKAEKL